MNRLTRYAIAAAVALGGTGPMVAAASAMPIGTITRPAAPEMVEHVAWGCGPGWHPNRWGRCVPNHIVVYPRHYAWRHPGWHPHRWHRWHRWHHL